MSAHESRVIIAAADKAAECTAWLDDGWDVETVCDRADLLDAVDENVGVVIISRELSTAASELVDEIRNRGIDRPVVLLSSEEPAADSVAMRFNDLLVTPVNESEVTKTVEQMCETSDNEIRKQEYVSLAATQAALELQLSPAEKQESEEYIHLTDRISQLRERAEDSLEAIGDQVA